MSSDVEARVRRANLLARDDQLEQLFGEDLSPRLRGRMQALEEGRMTEITTDEQSGGDEPVIERTGASGSRSASPKSAPRRRRLAPAALVAVVVALVGVPVGMFLADNSPTPVEIAESYIEARNAYDADQARELVADDFRTTEYPNGFRDADGMDTAFEGSEAYGFRYTDVDCNVANDVEATVWVECGYLWTSELHRLANQPPTPASLSFTIEDGLIQGVIRNPADVSGWWDPWLAFLRSEYPEFRSVVVEALSNEPEATRELVDGLPEHLALYEEWVDSQGG